MKRVEISKVQQALQLAVGIDDDHTPPVVVITMESSAEDGPHWLVYRTEADNARDIAKVLNEGADLIEGKLVDKGQYDANAEDFKEHHG